MTFRSVSFLVIVFFVCADSATIPTQMVELMHRLVTDYSEGQMKSESVFKDMTDTDKDCLNWYWDQTLEYEKQAKTDMSCDSCQSIFRCEHMTVKCMTDMLKSTENCCLNERLFSTDRIQAIHGKNEKCRAETGLIKAFKELGVTRIKSSDDMANTVMMAVWKYAKPQCQSKCNKDSASGTNARSVTLRELVVRNLRAAQPGNYDFIIGSGMNVADKMCINWYWDQIMAIENEEKSAFNCFFCGSILTIESNSTVTCCLSYLVLDRAEQVKPMHDKCKDESSNSGLGRLIPNITTAGDGAIWLTSKGRPAAQKSCTVQSASEDKCIETSKLLNGGTHGQSPHSVLFYLLLLIITISLNIL